MNNPEIQSVFVTGGAGFLGRQLIKKLLEANLHVRSLVRDLQKAAQGIQDLNLSPEQLARLTWVQGDLSDRALIQSELSKCQVVYHLAAALKGTPQEILDKTLPPTQLMLEESAHAKIKRFVLVSSFSVYSPKAMKAGMTLNESIEVDSHPENRDAYSSAKIRQEKLVWELSQKHGLGVVVVRPGMIFGPGRSLITARVGVFVGPMLIRLAGNNPLPYTYVENCAEAIALAGTTPGIDGEIINVVDDDLPTADQLVQRIRNRGRKLKILRIPTLAVLPFGTLFGTISKLTGGLITDYLNRSKCLTLWTPMSFSNEKAKRLLNWRPQISMNAALDQTVGETQNSTKVGLKS